MKFSKKTFVMVLLIASVMMTTLGCGEKDKGKGGNQPGGNTTQQTK